MELKKNKLSEIIESFIPGDWGEESFSSEYPNAVRCVRGADIVPIWNSDYDHIPVRYISNRSFANKQLKVGDIIIEKSGGSPTQSTGRTAFVSEELISNAVHLVCTNFCTAFRIKPGWNPKYVYYYLQHLYNNDVFFNFEGKTSGLKNLQIENAFDKATITQIPIEKQNQIVEVLDTLDRKIALNRAINRNLESLAKQLYDYWFVQFDFPDENGRPYKSSGGKMVWNEVLKREVPEGWEVNRLGDLINLEDYKRVPLSSSQRANRKGSIPYYGATGIMDYIDDYIFDYDILLLAEDGSTSDGNGFPVVQYVWGKVWVNNHAHIIIPKDKKDLIYTYYMLKSIPVKLIETGSIQKKISQENLLNHRVLVVPEIYRSRYADIVDTVWEKRKHFIEEITFLTLQRDELLPLLMNGQVEVKQLNSDL